MSDMDVRKSAAKVLDMIFSAQELGATRHTLTEILVDWAAPWASAKPEMKRACPNCGATFVAGAQMRSTAIYCSNRCRVAVARARKRKAALEEPVSSPGGVWQKEISPPSLTSARKSVHS